MDDSAAGILLGHLPDMEGLLRVGARLLAAVILGALIGIQRELVGKPAGLRTHALVTLAAAIFTVVPLEAGMAFDAVSRVIQGVATGIGFIGAGVILKRQEEGEVIGLTTAATVWAATGVGVAVGLGHVLLACIAVGLAWLVLAAFTRIDRWVEQRRG
jgi:putative Mg2+ transporter-C (MgtC) family protein